MDFACIDKYEKFPDRKSMLEYAGIPASPDKVQLWYMCDNSRNTTKKEMWRRSWCWKEIKVCISVKVYVLLEQSTLDKIWLLCGGCWTLPDLLFLWALPGGFFVIHFVVFQEVPLFLIITNGIKNAPSFRSPCHCDDILKPSYRK